MYALIQDDDVKSQEIARHISDIDLYRMKGSPIKIPVYIISQILKRKKRPKAIILRYLNDSESFIKSFIRFITDMITVIMAKIMRVKLIWICHNVDKESKEYYPFLVKIRRRIVSLLSERILVTDKYLMKHASRFLKVDQSKVNFITFGMSNTLTNLDIDDDVHKKIIHFIGSENEKNTYVGFSIGNPNPKVLHPFYTDMFIKKGAEYGVNIKIVLGGPLSGFIKKYDFNTYKKLLSNPNVLFLDGNIKLNESYISQFIDFYWRVYDDYSVPFTVYNAAHLKKPILTMNKGFLKEMILGYDLGCVLENDMSNLLDTMNLLNKDRTKKFNEFVETHNWSVGAKQLYKTIFS